MFEKAIENLSLTLLIPLTVVCLFAAYATIKGLYDFCKNRNL